MNQIKRIKKYQMLGVIIALLSLTLSVGTLTTTYAYTGVATVSKEIYDVELKDVTDFFEDGEKISVLKNPIIIKDNILYGVSLGNVNEYTKFQFNIENSGNVNAKVKKINITGFEEYKDYVDIQIKGVNEGQIIKGNSIEKIDVITKYNTQLLDDDGMAMPINLNEINISVVLDKE